MDADLAALDKGGRGGGVGLGSGETMERWKGS